MSLTGLAEETVPGGEQERPGQNEKNGFHDPTGREISAWLNWNENGQRWGERG